MVAAVVVVALGRAECSCFDSWHCDSDASGVVFFALLTEASGPIVELLDASRSRPVAAVL
jgi:hypothetical protein